MSKVKIEFPSWFMLWEFKQVFKRNVVKTNLLRRSLICVCTESQIELAIYAYNAKVIAVKSSELEPQGFTLRSLPLY